MSPSKGRKPAASKPATRPSGTTVESLVEVEAALHDVTRRSVPGLHVVRKWENDWYAGTDLILCIGAFHRHVGVEFWRGSLLAPRHALLEGTGKNLRHVKVRTLAEARSPALRRLIQEAARLDRTSAPRTR